MTPTHFPPWCLSPWKIRPPQSPQQSPMSCSASYYSSPPPSLPLAPSKYVHSYPGVIRIPAFHRAQSLSALAKCILTEVLRLCQNVDGKSDQRNGARWAGQEAGCRSLPPAGRCAFLHKGLVSHLAHLPVSVPRATHAVSRAPSSGGFRQDRTGWWLAGGGGRLHPPLLVLLQPSLVVRGERSSSEVVRVSSGLSVVLKLLGAHVFANLRQGTDWNTANL